MDNTPDVLFDQSEQENLMKNLLMVISMGILPTTSPAASAKYVCDFPLSHSLDEMQMQQTNGFSMAFTFDTITNDAFIEGNGGVSPARVFRGQEGITFLEGLSSGAVQTTTILPSGAAVHSRHTIISGDLVPSQSYGECK